MYYVFVFFPEDGLNSPTCQLEGTMHPHCASKADPRQFLWSEVAASSHQRRFEAQSCWPTHRGHQEEEEETHGNGESWIKCTRVAVTGQACCYCWQAAKGSAFLWQAGQVAQLRFFSSPAATSPTAVSGRESRLCQRYFIQHSSLSEAIEFCPSVRSLLASRLSFQRTNYNIYLVY